MLLGDQGPVIQAVGLLSQLAKGIVRIRKCSGAASANHLPKIIILEILLVQAARRSSI